LPVPLRPRPQPEVIDALIEHLKRVKEAFADGDLTEPFVAYVRSGLSPALQRFGKTRAEGEDEAVSLLRQDLLEGWRSKGRTPRSWTTPTPWRARTWRTSPSIDPALAGTALQLSATRGDMACSKRYRRLFEKARVPADRGRYLAALGSFRRRKSSTRRWPTRSTVRSGRRRS